MHILLFHVFYIVKQHHLLYCSLLLHHILSAQLLLPSLRTTFSHVSLSPSFTDVSKFFQMVRRQWEE